MNITIRCIDELVQQLPVVDGRLDAAAVPAAIARYEHRLRPEIERELAGNHRAGMAMDNPERRSFDGLIEKLSAVQASRDELMAYAFRTAGYQSLA